MDLTVGILGLGNMGSRMAVNVARAGFSLSIYNRTQSKADAVSRETEARVCASPAEVAATSNAILTMVSDATALKDLYFGPGGLAETLKPGTVCIEMSTVGPGSIKRLNKLLKPLSVHLLDAPVSGSVAMAENGQLTIMVGGELEPLNAVRPVLNALATYVFHVGALGSGATMKLAINAIVFGLNQALAEGLVLAESAGIARKVAYDLFENSAVAAPFVHYRKAAFLEPGGVPVAFPLDLAKKDLELIELLAKEVGAPMPQTATNQATVEAAVHHGIGGNDVSAVAEYLRNTRKSLCQE